jgi:hypothetical protein
MGKITILALAIFFISAVIKPSNKIEAAKKFIPKNTITKKVVSSSIPSIVKYKPDRKGLYFSFSHFNGIASVSYSFTYDTNGNPQGAGGIITANNNPLEQRELLFGTCSTSICTYHNNISNARLTLIATFVNGRKSSKIYKIKSSL